MGKTVKNRSKNNTSKKNVNMCPIGLKLFEEQFSKTLPVGHLKKSSELKKKEFVKELLSKFAPNSIKPENDFYDYINYQWLQNVSVEKQQDYIVQIDDFRPMGHILTFFFEVLFLLLFLTVLPIYII